MYVVQTFSKSKIKHYACGIEEPLALDDRIEVGNDTAQSVNEISTDSATKQKEKRKKKSRKLFAKEYKVN